MIYSLCTWDITGNQRFIVDYNALKYSNHYSSEGSGFGYLTFELQRQYGVTSPDIAYGYSIRLTKGLKKVLFHGIITKIEPSSDGKIAVSCVGYDTLLNFDIFNWVFSDNRTNQWVTGCDAKGSYRPDLFDYSTTWSITNYADTEYETTTTYDGIEITARASIEYTLGDYYYARYRFEFGESVARLQASYSISLPNNWPGTVQIVDSADTVLWEKSTTNWGTLDLTITPGTYVEIIFKVTTSGLNTSSSVWARFWDIVVSSETAVNAGTVGLKCAEHMHTYFGFSDDYSQIDTIDYPLEQAAFDSDETLAAVMNKVCAYGDAAAKPVAWGTLMDDTKTMFVEVQDLATIGYLITEPGDFTVSGNIAESSQKVYAKYTNTYGEDKRTPVYEAEKTIWNLGGLYRKTMVTVDGQTTLDNARQAAQLYVNENSEPTVQTSFTVVGVENLIGGKIPFDEIQSGKMCQVPKLEATAVAVSTDKRSGYSFMLTSVEVDLENGTASLSPANALSTFERYIALLARMRK
jgi:hypothetical protein